MNLYFLAKYSAPLSLFVSRLVHDAVSSLDWIMSQSDGMILNNTLESNC